MRNRTLIFTLCLLAAAGLFIATSASDSPAIHGSAGGVPYEVNPNIAGSPFPAGKEPSLTHVAKAYWTTLDGMTTRIDVAAKGNRPTQLDCVNVLKKGSAEEFVLSSISSDCSYHICLASSEQPSGPDTAHLLVDGEGTLTVRVYGFQKDDSLKPPTVRARYFRGKKLIGETSIESHPIPNKASISSGSEIHPATQLTEKWNDETDEDNKPLWSKLRACLPTAEHKHIFGVDAAWLDRTHSQAVCVLFGTNGPGVSMYDYTNAYVVIADRSSGEFISRQMIKLWDAKEDHSKAERLSLPMHHRRLSQKWRNYPTYALAKISTLDVDADKDQDLLINLVGDGGSYNSAETFVLQNNNGTYSIILNKTGAESQRFGTDAKRISRINDFDADGIPEIMIWDELPAPGPHANCRCWMDIYHWDGSRMTQCNSLFPQAYEQSRQGFFEISERYPDQTPEFYYYLGMISEYKHQLEQAVEYYVRSSKCPTSSEPYIKVANGKLQSLGNTIRP